MPLQLAGVVIARQIEIVQARDNAVIDDLNDVRLLHIFRHAIDDGAIFFERWRTETFAIALDHFRQIKIDLIAGSILHQRQSVAVFDLAAHGRNSHCRLRAATNLRSPFGAVRYLYPPESERERAHSQQH